MEYGLPDPTHYGTDMTSPLLLFEGLLKVYRSRSRMTVRIKDVAIGIENAPYDEAPAHPSNGRLD